MSPSEAELRQLRFMERLEKYGYIAAGLSFLILGMVVFFYGWLEFVLKMTEGPSRATLVLMNDLLLVVILLELFRTVINFLKSRTISLEPFLHVGIIAAVRRLLTIGAEMTLRGDISETRFNQYLLDALVSIGIILALVIALYIYGLRSNSAEPTGPK
ncbi:MAG TPA: phosphate-starvation-inducible PsiE family protein [Nitrospiria bacterium]|nr:phosphate-starvation-inducible PsiE family protein [Nitrospiria bacterium]